MSPSFTVIAKATEQEKNFTNFLAKNSLVIARYTYPLIFLANLGADILSQKGLSPSTAHFGLMSISFLAGDFFARKK